MLTFGINTICMEVNTCIKEVIYNLSFHLYFAVPTNQYDNLIFIYDKLYTNIHILYFSYALSLNI